MLDMPLPIFVQISYLHLSQTSEKEPSTEAQASVVIEMRPFVWRGIRAGHEHGKPHSIARSPLSHLPNRLQATGPDASVTADNRHTEIDTSCRHQTVWHVRYFNA